MNAGLAQTGHDLLATRLRPPVTADALIRRPRLFELLRNNARHALICAPPGFGKTSLLILADEHVRSEGYHTGWFTCDPIDDVPDALNYLAAALKVDDPSLPELVEKAPGRAIQLILAKFHEEGSIRHLLVDDVCQWRQHVRLAVLLPLLRLAPPNLKVLCASGRPLNDVASITDLEIGQSDLRLNYDEALELCGRGLSRSRTKELYHRSQGWPFVLNVIAAEHRQVKGRAQELQKFVQLRLLPYLSSDHIASISRLVALGNFDFSLGRQVTSEEILDQLCELGLVGGAAGRNARNYCINPVLGPLLSSGSIVDVRSIKRDAAMVLLSRGDPVAATQFAIQIGDEALATKIVDDFDWRGTFLGPGIAQLEKVTKLIPTNMLTRSLPLSCAKILSQLKRGHLREAREMLEGAKSVVGTDLYQASFDLIMISVLLDLYQGKLVSRTGITDLRAIASTAKVPKYLLESIVATFETYLEQSYGNLEDARRWAEKGVSASNAAGARYSHFFHECDLATIEGASGRASAGLEIMARTIQTHRDLIQADERLSVIADSFRLELEHEKVRSDFRRMDRLRTLCRRLPKLEGWPEVFAAAFRTYSEKLALCGDLNGALALLQAGKTYAERQNVASLVFIFDHQRALLLAQAGALEAAHRATEAHAGLSATQILSLSWREMEVCVEARIAIGLDTPLRDAALVEAKRRGLVRVMDRLDAVLNPQEMIAPQKSVTPAHPFLSPRSKEILAALRQGLSDKEIGRALGISPHGVRYHLKRLYAQHHLSSRHEACTIPDTHY